MIYLFLIVAFTAHLVAVNIAAAAPLLCIVLEWRESKYGDIAAGQIGRRLATFSLAALVLGITIGGLLLAMLWYADSDYWAALGRVPLYRWWFAIGEIIFYLACMSAYVLLWDRASRQRRWHRLLAIFAATNLLYHFPPLFTVISLLAARSDLEAATLDRSLYLQLFSDGEMLSRVAHHWLASLTTAGVALFLLATRREVADDAPSSNPAAFIGARTALAATVLQLPIGLWLLLRSPAAVQSQLLGADTKSTLLFVVAILAAVLFLKHLAAAALADTRRQTAIQCAALLLLVLLLMSAILHGIRMTG